MEHHSNLLEWRESGALVIEIKEDIHGNLDVGQLDEYLKKYSYKDIIIGSFCAASNITGVMIDVEGRYCIIQL